MEQTRRVLTVTALTLQIRRLLEKEIGQVWVTGEITNLRAQNSADSGALNGDGSGTDTPGVDENEQNLNGGCTHPDFNAETLRTQRSAEICNRRAVKPQQKTE